MALILVLLACGAAFAASGPVALLKERCQGCHGPAQQMAGLRLDQRDFAMKVITVGNGAASKLIHRVSGRGGAVMPPTGKPLSPDEIAMLRDWIDKDARWLESNAADHWAFRPVRPSASSIDDVVRARLASERIAPAPEADKRTLLRRVSLDITGLLPTPEEIAAFLADSSPRAYTRVVDRLLASSRFGERWARPWLDRARYADSDGYEKDWMRPHAWRYRHWVIAALNRDMPFDQFTIEQIAGDLIPGATVEQRVAAGFHRQTLTNREGGVDNRQFAFENAVDRASTVAATWLGLTAGCAQCHDHKYDPVTQREFYSFHAFFESLEETDIDAPMPGELSPYLRKRDEYRAKREAILAEYNIPALQAGWEKRMLEAAANPGKSTDWDLGWAVLATLTRGGDGEKIIRVPLDQRTERERDILTYHFLESYHFAVGNPASKAAKVPDAFKKINDLMDAYPKLTQAMTVAESAPSKHYVRVRGDFRNNGAEVERGTPSVLPPLRVSGRPSRLDLARWVVSRENPLTARVTVNWVWQEIFGRGLVQTPEDFGLRSNPPTHPELLDALAARFMDGWSLKALVREIVTSSTYKQDSRTREDLREKDPANTLLARQSRVRMPAEMIRDAALTAAGLLSDEVGGKSIYPPQPAGVAELGYGNRWGNSWPESQGRDRYKRGLYIHFQRSTPYPMLMNFDAPKANLAQCKRERSNTALQALNLLNDPVFLEAAEAIAYQSIAEGGDFDARLDAATVRTLGRRATDRERAKHRRYLDQQRAIFAREPDSARHLASASVSGMDRAETAAWVGLATVLLNLDEFITKE